MDDGSDQVEELTLEPPSSPDRPGRAGVLWAVLAVGALIVGGVVVTAADDDGDPRPGLPVALGAARTAGEAAADAMLAPVTYVAGDDLPALGGEATAYRLASSVTEDQVRALADALGIAGDVTHDGPSWVVDDGVAHLEVYDGGGAAWWYSATGGGVVSVGGSSGSGAVDSCVQQTDDVVVQCEVLSVPSIPTTSVPECTASDGAAECITGAAPTTTIDCGPGADCVVPAPPLPDDPDCPVSSTDPAVCADVEPPPPPADLPTEDEARTIALDLLAATGTDVDDAVVRVDGGFDAWFVSVEPRLDGVPSGLVASITVGSGGEVTMAGGLLGEPEPLGSYPLLDTRAAIDRANAGTGGAPTVAGDLGATSTDTTVPPCKVQPDGREICETDSATAGSCETLGGEDAMDQVVTCELPACPQAVGPADEPLGAPETIDCDVPTPAPDEAPPVPGDGTIEVVLVDADPALVLLPALDGSTDVYLVPAYRFTDADGGTVDLPAVDDSALTNPPTTDTSAVEPPVTDTVVEPQPCDPSDCVSPDPVRLADGEVPEIGVGYYVDVDTTCHEGSFEFAGEIWNIDGGTTDGWSTPHEGGTFTLDAPDHGTFVGDAGAATKTGSFRPRSPEAKYGCVPAPRP